MTQSDSNYARLRALFERCIDLPEGERVDWLDRHVSDTGQRIELELMIAADSGAGGFLECDVAEHIDRFGTVGAGEFQPESLVGRQFGAFRLQRLIGSGGQGTVYLAERVGGDFAQCAAVKLLRRGIHDPAEHRRFRREREILARFEHAGVARLIDGGVSGDGVPYLVMEYVEGLCIDKWCESHALDCRARLTLFAQLCQVVAAAHRALIVHRDLKPTNVLVSTEGTIKVLDFGIARLLDEGEDRTHTAVPLLTPGYGAPEQARGGSITLATDVHALGMLLRVLLTGEPPPKAGESQALPLHLAPELRWVIGKATTAEPERRYRDATELGDDLARYLDARPVLAHPPSRWYTTRKFVARHRGSVFTTLAVFLAILTSAGIALWQAQVAREQAQRAEATRSFLLGVFDAAQEDLPRDARPTPDNLARAAAQRLESDAKLDALSRADFLAALAAISHSSNDHEQALQYADRAMQLYESRGQSTSRAHLAIEALRASALIRLGRAEEADRALRARVDLFRATIDEVTIEGLSAYAMARLATGHQDDGIALTREAVDAAVAYGHDVRNELSMRLGYGFALAKAGRLPEAVAVLQETQQRWDASGSARDYTYANLLNNLAAIKVKLGRFDEGIAQLREALAVRRSIYDPPHEKIANTLQSLATALGDRGEFEEAAKLLDEAAAMYTERFGPDHPQSIWAMATRAKLDIKRGNPQAALEPLQGIAAQCEARHLDKDPGCVYAQRSLAEAWLDLGRLDEAAAAAERSVALHLALYSDHHSEYAMALITQADVLLRRDAIAAAQTNLEQAAAIFHAQGQDETLSAASILRLKATALHALRRHSEALTAIEAAQAITQRLAAKDSSRRLALLALRAEVLAALERHVEARDAARQALALPQAATQLTAERKQALEVIARLVP